MNNDTWKVRGTVLIDIIARAVEVGFRYPLLLVLPVVWEYVQFMGFQPLDASVRYENGQLSTFAPPPSLLWGLLASLIGAAFLAGCLCMWRTALRDEAPTLTHWVEGVQQFFWRFIGWDVLVGVVGILCGLIAVATAPIGFILLIALALAAIAFSMVHYLIAARDMSISDAMWGSSELVGSRLLTLIGLLLLGFLVSLPISFVIMIFGAAGQFITPMLTGVVGAIGMGALMTLSVDEDPTSE